MRSILGKSLIGRRVVSHAGLDMGTVLDAYFELDGKIINIMVKPERESKQINKDVNRDGLLEVPFSAVRAIGKYVVVEYPFSKE